jgi:hypothetical protein
MQIINSEHMRKHMFPAVKRRARLIFAIIKPTFTALAFLLASGLFPGSLTDSSRLDSPKQNNQPCVSSAATGSLAWLGAVKQSGSKAVDITSHAAERMRQRGVSLAMVANTIKPGNKFPYKHTGIFKIGYYDEATKIFVATDGKNGRVITVIKGISSHYVSKLKQTIHIK